MFKLNFFKNTQIFRNYKKAQLIETYNSSLSKLQSECKSLKDSTYFSKILKLKSIGMNTHEPEIKEHSAALTRLINEVEAQKGHESWKGFRSKKLRIAVRACLNQLAALILEVFPKLKHFLFSRMIKIGCTFLNIKLPDSFLNPDKIKNAIDYVSLLWDLKIRCSKMILINLMSGKAISEGQSYVFNFIAYSNIELAKMIRGIKFFSLILNWNELSPLKILHIPDFISLIKTGVEVGQIIGSSDEDLLIKELKHIKEDLSNAEAVDNENIRVI